MRELVKTTTKICSQCKYVTGFGSQPGKLQTNRNICCNYLDITGHSRIFKNGRMVYDREYCDKFERGQRTASSAWSSDNMTLWKKTNERREQFRKNEKNTHSDINSGYFDGWIREN